METTTGYRCPQCGQAAVMHPWDEGTPQCGGIIGNLHDPIDMERDPTLDGPLVLPPPDSAEEQA